MQYLTGLGRALTGDLGISCETGRPVTSLLAEGLAATSAVTGLALLLAVLVGAGVALSATGTRFTWLSRTLLNLPPLGVAIPGFWLGLMLLEVFSFRLAWFPAIGNEGFGSLVLPAITLAVPTSALIATSSLAHNTPGWTDQSDAIVFDPTQAAAVLDADGWTIGADGVRQKDGQRLHLVVAYISNFGPNQTALELIQQQLGDSGIEVELWTGTVPDLRAGLAEGKFDVVRGNLSRADGDVLRTQFSATGGTNWYKIDDAELEAALAGQQSTADQAKRDEYLATAQQILVDQVYNIPVLELTTVVATDPQVYGVVPGADSRLSQLTDAFVAG